MIKAKNGQKRNNAMEFWSNIFFGIKIDNKEKRKNKNIIYLIYDKLDEIIKK